MLSRRVSFVLIAAAFLALLIYSTGFDGWDSSIASRVSGYASSGRNCKYMLGQAGVVAAISLDDTQDSVPQLERVAQIYRCLPPEQLLVFSNHERNVGRFKLYDVRRPHEATDDRDAYAHARHQQQPLTRRDGTVHHEPSESKNILSEQSQEQLDKQRKEKDKQRLLHMVLRAWHLRPHQEWYLFTTSSTYMSLPNLLTWLHTLDATQPHLLGNALRLPHSETDILDPDAPVLISGAALHALLTNEASILSSWPRRTASSLTSHHALSALFHTSLGLNVTDSWPLLHGETIAGLTFLPSQMCDPIVSLHGLATALVPTLLDLEARFARIPADTEGRTSYLAHDDLFSVLSRASPSSLKVFPGSRATFAYTDRWDDYAAVPSVAGEVVQWSYPSALHTTDPNASPAECALACEAEGECVMFSFMSYGARWAGGSRATIRKGGVCFLSKGWRFGGERAEERWEDDGGDGRNGPASVVNTQEWSSGWFVQRWREKVGRVEC